jgi:CheY-like chemotaxis protein
MPRLDGFEATRRLREAEERSDGPHRVTVVALTANAMKGDRDRCIDAGMDDYLAKPLVPPKLIAKLDAIARRRLLGETGPKPSDTPPDTEVLVISTGSASTVLVRALSGFEKRAYSCLRDIRHSVAARDLDTAESLVRILTGAARTLDQDALLVGIEELKTSIRAEDFALMEDCLESLSKQLERCFRDFLV